MLHRRARAALAAAALSVGLATAGVAQAAPDPAPSFSRCPAVSGLWACMVIQSTDGAMRINSTTVPLGSSIKIEGGLKVDPVTGASTFIPPTSGSALTSTPVTVPGGLLGIPLPLGFDTVKATTKLVGSVKANMSTGDLSMPVVIKLDNPLLGSGCQIGQSWMPIRLNLTTGTTSPPPPNTPVTGKNGEPVAVDDDTLEIQGSIHNDNAFSVPIALDCGYLTGILVTTAVNLKLGLPSAAGRNALTITNNLFLRTPGV